MSQVIKSLPSTYNGVLFRSRLEARWAALFDSYRIRWAYEPEGFETPSGNYLPDFLLPDLGYYVEVKPGPLMYDERAVCSVSEQTGKRVLILDSPVVECRQFVFVDISGTYWNDMTWCDSCLIDGNSFTEIKQFFTGLSSGDEPCRGYSLPCAMCGLDRSITGKELPNFHDARNLRFNNGVAA